MVFTQRLRKALGHLRSGIRWLLNPREPRHLWIAWVSLVLGLLLLPMLLFFGNLILGYDIYWTLSRFIIIIIPLLAFLLLYPVWCAIRFLTFTLKRAPLVNSLKFAVWLGCVLVTLLAQRWDHNPAHLAYDAGLYLRIRNHLDLETIEANLAKDTETYFAHLEQYHEAHDRQFNLPEMQLGQCYFRVYPGVVEVTYSSGWDVDCHGIKIFNPEIPPDDEGPWLSKDNLVQLSPHVYYFIELPYDRREEQQELVEGLRKLFN